MAHISIHSPASTTIMSRVRNIFARVGQALVTIGESSARMRHAKALMAMTDTELDDRGLRRDQIARYVFGDIHWM